ncbi:hypothetical protein AB7M23_001628 [Pseudomonas sp. HLS-6 TE3448]
MSYSPVGAGLPAIQTPRSCWHHADAIAGKPGSHKMSGGPVGAGLPAIQTPRSCWHHADAIAGKPGSHTMSGSPVGAGLPAIETPRSCWHHADAIAGKPGSYTLSGSPVGAGLPAKLLERVVACTSVPHQEAVSMVGQLASDGFSKTCQGTDTCWQRLWYCLRRCSMQPGIP